MYRIDVIYSSPLKRAYETASIIGKSVGIDQIMTDRRLVERDFGVLTGKPVSDINKYAKNIFSGDRIKYFLDARGAERFPTLLRRVGKVLDEVCFQNQGKTIVIVTHGDVGKMILAAYNHWTWERGLQTPYFDNTDILELSQQKNLLLSRKYNIISG